MVLTSFQAAKDKNRESQRSAHLPVNYPVSDSDGWKKCNVRQFIALLVVVGGAREEVGCSRFLTIHRGKLAIKVGSSLNCCRFN